MECARVLTFRPSRPLVLSLNFPWGPRMNMSSRVAKILSSSLIVGLCLTPEMMPAQQSAAPAPASNSAQQQTQPASPAQTPAQPQPSQQSSQPSNQNRGTTVDPAQAPLQPVTTYPDASDNQQQEAPGATAPSQAPASVTTLQDAPQPKKPPAEPVGAAAAEKVPTVGGAASRPAGAAIAPAKQRQTRSLLLKIGAIAAAGAALGTVYALSRGTPSSAQ